MFKKATKSAARLRMAVTGVSGSGKTMSAIKIAQGLCEPGQRVAVIDTERGSASKYADIDFDVVELDDFDPRNYIRAMHAAANTGVHGAIVIDSLSHAWIGKGGILDKKDAKGGDSFGAWRSLTPLHNELVDAILACPLHVIVTLRSKTDYAVEKDSQGKTRIAKLGLGYVQREGIEYEFDVVADMDLDHYMTVSKTRCEHLDSKRFYKPGNDVSEILRGWLTDGYTAPPAPNPVPDASAGSKRPEYVARYWKTWLTLKERRELGDHVLTESIEHLGIAGFKTASEDELDRLIAHIERTTSETAAPEPAGVAAPAADDNGDVLF